MDVVSSLIYSGFIRKYLLGKLSYLYFEKWSLKKMTFENSNLESLKHDILCTLEELNSYLTDEFLRHHEATAATEGKKHRICQNADCGLKQFDIIPILGTPEDTNGNVEKEVNVEAGAPDTIMNNSKQDLINNLLTPEEQQKVAGGEKKETREIPATGETIAPDNTTDSNIDSDTDNITDSSDTANNAANTTNTPGNTNQLNSVPKTGDYNRLEWWSILALLSGAGVVFFGRRNKKEVSDN